MTHSLTILPTPSPLRRGNPNPLDCRHGSSELGPRSRTVLVGSLIVKGRDRWQRFVGIWRLWGLFSRQVRYAADKRLPSSGVDTIPTLDPEPKKGSVIEAAEGVSREMDGDKQGL